MLLKKIAAIGLLLWLFAPKSIGQVAYGSSLSQIYSADLTTCSVSPICACPPLNDMCISPSGLFYGIYSLTIASIDGTNGAVTPIADVSGGVPSSLEWGQDGFLYAMGDKIWQINPTTGDVVITGNLPAGWSSIGDLVYLDGIYYGTVSGAGFGNLVNVNLANPSASTIVSPLPSIGLVAGSSANDPNCPRLFWYKYGAGLVYYYDVNTSTWGTQCSSFPIAFGGADSQNDYSFPFTCSCTTNAGNVTNQANTICGTDTPAVVPFTGGETLDSDDILRYILFTNLNNPAGSILVQSSSPNIPFNPATMTVGQTYYLGTLAGNNAAGVVNLADPCKDFSDQFAQIIWRNKPSVSFSVANPQICEGGCKVVTANFVGTPPFGLTYQTVFASGMTVNFPTSPGTFEVCPPAGTPLGSFNLSAVEVADLFCLCN